MQCFKNPFKKVNLGFLLKLVMCFLKEVLMQLMYEGDGWLRNGEKNCCGLGYIDAKNYSNSMLLSIL